MARLVAVEALWVWVPTSVWLAFVLLWCWFGTTIVEVRIDVLETTKGQQLSVRHRISMSNELPSPSRQRNHNNVLSTQTLASFDRAVDCVVVAARQAVTKHSLTHSLTHCMATQINESFSSPQPPLLLLLLPPVTSSLASIVSR